MGTKAKQTRRVLFLGAGASAAFGYPVTGQIFPRLTEGLASRTLLPLESNPKRERAKMNRLRQHLEALLPAVLEDDIELPLITDVLSLIDLLLSTGEVAVPMLSTKEMEDLRALLEEAIVEMVERGSDDPRSLETLDRLTDWMLNALDLDGAPLTIVSTNYDTLVESLLFEKITMDPVMDSAARSTWDSAGESTAGETSSRSSTIRRARPASVSSSYTGR